MAAARYLFVIGTGRCGSTILARILATHPDIGSISRFPVRVARVVRAVGLEPRPQEAEVALGEQVSRMLVDPFRDLTAADAAPWLERRLRRFFDDRARAEGRAVFMHKFTGWPRARLLAVVFPEAKFVHLVRDGRSVANSLVQVGWWRGFQGVPAWMFGQLSEEERLAWETTRHSWPYLAGLEWRRLMAAFADARAEVAPERWLDVRYEDFVAQPAEETAAILRFAGLGHWDGLEAQLERFHVSAERADAYRRELRPEDVEQLESLLGPTLEYWGYAGAAAADSEAALPSQPGGATV